jgi:hypothetical protein
VPSSSEGLAAASPDSLARSWRAFEQHVLDAGVSADEGEIVTTSCGVGSLSEAEAYRALDLLKRLPDAARKLGKG